MNIISRPVNLHVHKTKRNKLNDSLKVLNVIVDGIVSKVHLDLAHKNFRDARGESVEVNVAWTEVKQWICVGCGGKKSRSESQFCSKMCPYYNQGTGRKGYMVRKETAEKN